jgi:hypothetical protein
MTLSIGKLAVELERLVPVIETAEGIGNFADGFTAYFYESELQIVPAPPLWGTIDGSLDAARDALVAAMVLTAAVDAAGAISAGITAFWGAISANPVAVWSAVPVIAVVTPPPSLASIGAAVAATGTANIAAGLGLKEAAYAMATTIHPFILGGTATDTTAPTPKVYAIV